MLSEIIADNGGRMKHDVLKGRLKALGYPHLIERLEAMGFTVDDEGYVHARAS